MPASRSLVRGRSTARAGGPEASAAVVTAAGIRLRFRISGTAKAAVRAAAAAPFTSGPQGDDRLGALPLAGKGARV